MVTSWILYPSLSTCRCSIDDTSRASSSCLQCTVLVPFPVVPRYFHVVAAAVAVGEVLGVFVEVLLLVAVLLLQVVLLHLQAVLLLVAEVVVEGSVVVEVVAGVVVEEVVAGVVLLGTSTELAAVAVQ